MLALRLPENIEVRLSALAKITGRSKSFYAREAILQHLEALESHYLPPLESKLVQDKIEYERWFRAQVQEGIDQADSSDAEFLSIEQVDAEIEKIIHDIKS
jgi:RHH-type transcriptional regulator, rel operon repressor / antitoxin RelB